MDSNTCDFKERLSDIMFERKMTTRELAEVSGCSQTSISAWTRGVYPKLSNITKLADYLDCSIDFLLGRTDNTKILFSNKSNFIERLKTLLLQEKIKVYSLQKECGVSNSMASKWQKGKIPKLDTLIVLANYFDCSVDYLIGRTEIR